MPGGIRSGGVGCNVCCCVTAFCLTSNNIVPSVPLHVLHCMLRNAPLCLNNLSAFGPWVHTQTHSTLPTRVALLGLYGCTAVN